MNVRKLIFFMLSFFVLAGQKSFGQLCFPARKVYAFFQPVSKGVTSREEAKKNAASGNYLIFIETKRPGITLNKIWIGGVPFNGHLTEVTAPVMLGQPKGSGSVAVQENSTILVPATKNKVYRVDFTALDPASSGGTVPARYASKSLVMELHYRKRKKHLTASDIREVKRDALY